jgi:hypothetical protein
VRIGAVRWQLPVGESFQAFISPVGSFTSNGLTQCGITFSGGRQLLDVEHLQGIVQGIGVLGGASGRVDAGETLDVDLGIAVPQLGYKLTDGTNVGGSSTPAEHFVEAFDANGQSLGLRSEGGSDAWIDLAADYGGASIARFTLIGVNDQFRLVGIRFVPEPSKRATGSLAAITLLACRRPRGRAARTGQRAVPSPDGSRARMGPGRSS